MVCRIDVLDLYARAARPGEAQKIGYGLRFDAPLEQAELKRLAGALHEPRTQICRIKDKGGQCRPFCEDGEDGGRGKDGDRGESNEGFSDRIGALGQYIAEVRLRPGVTDNVGHSASSLLELARARFGAEWDMPKTAAGRIYALSGEEDGKGLYNPLIETLEILKAEDWLNAGFDAAIHPVKLDEQALLLEVSLELSDAKLTELSRRGILEQTKAGARHRGPLGLGLDDLQALQAKAREMGRNFTDIEIETFAQSWSEHCKHRFFSAAIDDIDEGIFARFIKSTTEAIMRQKPGFCLSVFHDNAGGIAFGDHVIAYKVETHNSPSALDPYGGAMTGVLGVNRDCLGFGMGAKPIANVFGYCLPEEGDESRLYRSRDKASALPSARALRQGVIRGIEEGGNHSGIPTVQGFVYEDARFRGKPLVFCGTLGIMPRRINGPEGEKASVDKRALAGDYIYVFGNHVGRDGIHGATFSSLELNDRSPASAVQIGDPISQKILMDALFLAREQGLYRSITDNGAGGLSSSIGEMAVSSGGAEVWLEEVALKYPGLAPWEIWISESQERMLAAVPPKCAAKFEALMTRYRVSAQRLGRFRDDGMLRLCFEGRELGTIDLEFLHEGAPRRAYRSKAKVVDTEAQEPERAPITLRALLELPNFCSRGAIFRRYDHEVQGNTILKPLIGGVDNQVSALRPIWNDKRAITMAQAMLPYLTEYDPFMAGFAAVDLAIRRLIGAGASPDQIAILDNFCWSRPETPERLFELKESARGLGEAALQYGAPIISGKDSMYNDFQGFDEAGRTVEISALPSLLISAIGVAEDHAHLQSFEFKSEGDLLALYAPGAKRLGRSAIDQAFGVAGEYGSRKSPGDFAASYRALFDHLAAGRLASVEALGPGGVGYALARAAMASGIGVQAEWADDDPFAELDSGFLVSISRENAASFGPEFQIIGETGGHAIAIGADPLSIDEARALYFGGALGEDASQPVGEDS